MMDYTTAVFLNDELHAIHFVNCDHAAESLRKAWGVIIEVLIARTPGLMFVINVSYGDEYSMLRDTDHPAVERGREFIAEFGPLVMRYLNAVYN